MKEWRWLTFVVRRYNTTSNKVRVIKTPGGELRYLHIKKAGTAPKCGDCGIKLPGVSAQLSHHQSAVIRTRRTLRTELWKWKDGKQP